jgi:DNA-binding PadR family transcriptional regulator
MAESTDRVDEYISNLTSEFLRGVLQLLILSAIEKEGESHGYKIIQDILEQSANLEIIAGARKGEIERTQGIRLKEGSIYPHLNRLEADGYLTARWDRNRKVYSLTRAGCILLDAIKKLYKDLNEVVIKIIELKKDGE